MTYLQRGLHPLSKVNDENTGKMKKIDVTQNKQEISRSLQQKWLTLIRLGFFEGSFLRGTYLISV